MLKDVQIEGQVWYVIPTKEIVFQPPPRMLMVFDVYFRNFPVLSMPKFMNEVFMYGSLHSRGVKLFWSES